MRYDYYEIDEYQARLNTYDADGRLIAEFDLQQIIEDFLNQVEPEKEQEVNFSDVSRKKQVW